MSLRGRYERSDVLLNKYRPVDNPGRINNVAQLEAAPHFPLAMNVKKREVETGPYQLRTSAVLGEVRCCYVLGACDLIAPTLCESKPPDRPRDITDNMQYLWNMCLRMDHRSLRRVSWR